MIFDLIFVFREMRSNSLFGYEDPAHKYSHSHHHSSQINTRKSTVFSLSCTISFHKRNLVLKFQVLKLLKKRIHIFFLKCSSINIKSVYTMSAGRSDIFGSQVKLQIPCILMNENMKAFIIAILNSLCFIMSYWTQIFVVSYCVL